MGDPVADELLREIRAAGAQGMTRTEIRDFFNRHKGVEKISRVLATLQQCGTIRQEPKPTGGRSAERWFANGSATKATDATEGTQLDVSVASDASVAGGK